MEQSKALINRGFITALAIILAVSVVASAGIGLIFGNSKTDPSGVVPADDPTGQTDPSGQTDPPSNTGDNTRPASIYEGVRPGRNIGGTGTINVQPTIDPDNPDAPELTPQQKAVTMQDYTIDPATGKAKEIKVTDKNYLILINRTHPLAASYEPDDLRTVNKVVSGAGVKGQTDKLRREAAIAFESMVAEADEVGIKIRMRVGYQSYEYHKTRIYDRYVTNYGRSYANTYSCEPGLSEHQTGLALDVAGASTNYTLTQDFLSTAEGKWVRAHCFEYGFIIRYTDGTADSVGKVTGFVSEPWHLRYVGEDVAAEIMAKGITLEEYLGILR